MTGASAPSGSAAEEGLRAALERANLPTLLLSLAQLTGEDRWLQDPYRPSRPKGPGDNDSGGFPNRSRPRSASRRSS